MNQANTQTEYCLVPIPLGRKGPTTSGWNLKENCHLPPGWTQNQGLAHAYSGTCAIDIDQLEKARFTMRLEYGIDLDELIDAPDAVHILSGRENRMKLIYKLPTPMTTKSIKEDGHDMLQFRCATKDGLTVQDVLPPSIHPDTNMPYQWGGRGHPGLIPVIPEKLQAVWQKLLDVEEIKSATPVDLPEIADVNMDDVREALNALDPDMDRDAWVRVGMALHSLSKDLYGDWDAWSAGGSKYRDSHDTHTVWKSFSDMSNPVTIRSLFKLARKAGWVQQFRAPVVEFQPVPTPTPGPAPLTGQLIQAAPVEDDPGRALVLRIQALPNPDTLDPEIQQDINQIISESLHLPPMSQQPIHEALRAQMHWTKTQLNTNIDYVRHRMGGGDRPTLLPPELTEIVGEYVYVAQIERFFRARDREFLTHKGFHAMHGHYMRDETSIATLVLDENLVEKASRIDYAPGFPRTFIEDGTAVCNMWTGVINRGRPGDATPWLQHFERLGWGGKIRDHLLKWMAFTLRHPERKINHIPILGGPEGNGKDFLLHPLKKSVGKRDFSEISGEMLLSDFQDHIVGVKYLHVNETEHGDHKDASRVVAKLKPLGASPPDTMRVNPKGMPSFEVRNIVNVTMTTNDRLPLLLGDDARRFYPLWTDVTFKGPDGNISKEGTEYWRQHWAWMEANWEICVHYLMNDVDLSDFNPGAHPPVTDFMREIQQASAHPLVDLIRDQLDQGEGIWRMDLVSSKDIYNHIASKGSALINMHGIRNQPSIKAVTQAMNKGRLALRIEKCIKNEGHVRLWAIRNGEKYQDMPGREVRDTYERSLQAMVSTSASPPTPQFAQVTS